MKTAAVREKIQGMVRQAPFRPFMLSLEYGQQVLIENPENIAFNPEANGTKGSPDFYVLTGKLQFWSTFEAVSSIAQVDAEGNGIEA